MNSTRKLALALLAVAALGGCATAPSAQNARAVDVQQVSRPAATYGAMGGYRYRRLVAVTVPAS